jgi:Domain of unknown function (DUF4185)
MLGLIPRLRLSVVCALLSGCIPAEAQPACILTWITNSSVKLEQIIGDVDWEAKAHGSNLLTASLTEARFHILGNGLGYSFEDNGKLIFLFGDTISENKTNWNYHAADPLAWSTNRDGEAPLLLNFYTNTPYVATNFTPILVRATGINLAVDDLPNSGISLSNGIFLVCNTGSDPNNPTNTHLGAYSVIISFNETNFLTATNTYIATNIFAANRVLSALNTNLVQSSPLQGHFIFTSLRDLGTNVMIFGTGEFRDSDVYLCMVPTANFLSGQGTLYFTGLTNGQPTWSTAESNSVPVVQDNPTNGPPWPNDAPAISNVSAAYSTNLALWFMTYTGGNNTGNKVNNSTTGVYFSYAPQPWGPWSTPQLIFNKYRDNGDAVFIHDPGLTNSDGTFRSDGLIGPTIGPDSDPTNSVGGDFAPLMIERFTRIANSTLFIYYTMSTWNPYTVVKMRSAFTIVPVIDPASLVHKKNKFSFDWSAPTNISYQVDYSTNLLTSWITITDLITSTSGLFEFTNTETGGLPPARFYRLRTTP